MPPRAIAQERYWVELDGSGPAILLLHGLGGTSNVYQPQVAALSQTHTIIRVDFEGHGNTPLESEALSIDQWADDVEALLQRFDVRAPGIVAHSAGCLVALRLAQRHPQRFPSLALLGPVFGQSDSTRRALRARAVRARDEGLLAIADSTLGTLSEHSKSANPLASAFVRELVLRQNPTGYAAACDAVSATPSFTPRPFSDVSLLLMTGELDSISAPAASSGFAEALPNARCEVLPDCGHWPTIERPAEVAHRLLAFFTSSAQ